MPVDFLQKQVAGRPNYGYAGPIRVIPTRWSFRLPRGERKLQPIDEFATDSLQIAQKENLDAIIDCVIAARARARPEDWLWSDMTVAK
jgi:hypothetical protein